MSLIQLLGFFGAALAGFAYWPQIAHLVKEHCSAGISRRAYTLWLIAAGVMLVNAISLQSAVFVALTSIQTLATGLILLLAAKYQGTCPWHTPPPA